MLTKLHMCEVGLISAGVTCELLAHHLARRRLRARSFPSAAVQQHSSKGNHTSWADRLVSWAKGKVPQLRVQRLDQLSHRSVILVLVFVAVLGSLRLSGARRRRKQKAADNIREDTFVPLKYMERDEPDAEPERKDWWTSMLAKDVRQVVPRKELLLKHPVPPSIGAEPEDEESTARASWPLHQGFVARRKAEVERVLQIFRMDTEGQVRLVDEEKLEQLDRERQVVPNGQVRSCAQGLEHKIQRRVSFA